LLDEVPDGGEGEINEVSAIVNKPEQLSGVTHVGRLLGFLGFALFCCVCLFVFKQIIAPSASGGGVVSALALLLGFGNLYTWRLTERTLTRGGLTCFGLAVAANLLVLIILISALVPMVVA
jgi:hypothetical protein